MKRHIILLFVAFIGMGAMAQSISLHDAVGKRPIDIRGSRVYVDDCKLDKYGAAACFSSLDGVDKSEDYLRYRAGYKTGLGLTFGGLALAGVGLVGGSAGFIVSLVKAFADQPAVVANTAMYVGLGSFFVGSACFLAGIPVACVYKSRLNKLEKAYNVSVQLQTTSNGLALSLNF